MKPKNHCSVCGAKTIRRSYRFCSQECHITYKDQIKFKEIEEGTVSNRPTLKRYLIKTFGRYCFRCKTTHWMDELIPLEVDHINGDAGNNYPSNLRLICPNCHAQTETAKGKNRGNGRKSRGLPVF